MAKENVNELVDKLTLFDDDLMSRVFDNNIEATELMLRIIMGRNINVISVIGQDEIKSHEVGGRNITLDVHAIDVNGDEIDIEVQGNSAGAHIRRARYHSSMVDSKMLDEYSCAITPQVRQAGNRLSGLTETAYASLLA